jgi:hypothetical protein
MVMRWKLCLFVMLQAAIVVLLAVAVNRGFMPLGVRGEWEWMRLGKATALPWGWLALAGLVVAAYAGFAGLGFRALSTAGSSFSEAGLLTGLWAAAIAVQIAIPMGAADEFDLTKWAYVNYFPASTGYFRIAREQAVRDPWQFLSQYPDWIRSQDSLHIGTHPPGLIVAQCVLMHAMKRNPALATFLVNHMPPSVEVGFHQLEVLDAQPIRRAERAGLYATALLTLLACAGTVVPLYLLARATLPASAAWAAACFWPLVPSANLFQPGADTSYPLLSTSAWALAAWAVRLQAGHHRLTVAGLLSCSASGLVMAFGMVFTLAFLPVGLITALIVMFHRAASLPVRAALLLATGAGFLAFAVAGWLVTGADPFVVWAWNLHHHARFYVEYPRTYVVWLWANPIEVAVALGLPAVLWAVAGLYPVRAVPGSVWAGLAVLAIVNLTGRNMGEVARLWMPFFPALLVATGHGFSRLRGGPVAVGVSVGLVGLETLSLQSMIQVVYPVS